MKTKKKSGALAGRYKKQHGLHHKHGNQYLKVYWPYIPVALIVFTGIVASLVILATKTSSSTSSTSISTSSLLSSTNTLRSSDKLGALQINQQLSTAAQLKANDMALNNYWSPVSPTGQTPWQLIQASGYNFSSVGENLAYGFNNSQTLLNGWLSSPSHKANILSPNYLDVGFGIARSPDYQNKGAQTIVVAFYGTTASPVASTPTNSSNTTGGFNSASLVQPGSQTIARVETLTGQHSYLSVFIVGLVAGTALGLLAIRHGLVIRKWATEGEALIIKHPVIDLCLVAIILGAASLNQTVGFIR